MITSIKSKICRSSLFCKQQKKVGKENLRGKKLCLIVAKDTQGKWCSKNLGIEEFCCKRK